MSLSLHPLGNLVLETERVYLGDFLIMSIEQPGV